MKDTQYECFNCEKELHEVNIYTTTKEIGTLEGNHILDVVETTSLSRTLECPFCKIDLPEGDLV